MAQDEVKRRLDAMVADIERQQDADTTQKRRKERNIARLKKERHNDAG